MRLDSYRNLERRGIGADMHGRSYRISDEVEFGAESWLDSSRNSERREIGAES